jgi:hypothetical protein
MNIHEILDKHFTFLRQFNNVLNINVGEEITKGKKTGRQAIIVYVKKKLPLEKLKTNEILPDYVDDVPIDVIEWTADYELGNTTPSYYNPKIQKKIASGVKK